MSPIQTAQPFYSPKNIPLWVCLILALTIGVVGIARHRSGAAEPVVAEAPSLS